MFNKKEEEKEINAKTEDIADEYMKTELLKIPIARCDTIQQYGDGFLQYLLINEKIIAMVFSWPLKHYKNFLFGVLTN